MILGYTNFFGSTCLHARSEEKKSQLTFNLTKSNSNPQSNILLIHGLTSSKETWNDNVHQRLAAYGNVWAIDLPGYGESFEIPFQTRREIIGSVLNFIEENKLFNLVIVGHSMGAKVAIIITSKLNIEKLIIEDMEPEPRRFSMEKYPKEFQNGFSSIDKMTSYLRKWDYYDRTIANTINNHVVCKNGRYFSKINPLTDWSYNKNINSKWSIKDDWISLPKTLPILVLKSQKNSSISRSGMQFMTSTKKGLKLKTIEGSTHSIHNSKTEEFVKEIENFIALP